MSPTLVSIFAQICAANARIAAMQATNAHWALNGSPPAYDESHFQGVAQELEALADAAKLA